MRNLIMTFSLLLFSSISWSYSSDSTLYFEGIIKVTFTNTRGDVDTIVRYYGNNKIRIVRMGRLASNYGQISDIYYDFERFPNTTFTWSRFNQKLESIEYEITNEIDKDQESLNDSIYILNNSCYLKTIKYRNFLFGYEIITLDKVYISKELKFNGSKGNHELLKSIFYNKHYHIGLNSERVVTSDTNNHDNMDITQINRMNKSTKHEVIEIIHKKLDKSIFHIPTIDF